ncbi:MAG: hypothetical protein KW802_03080, partial [Candidatus Doudnabacteria bacterium]|nr:hypothetical protein [Candidatus Doudnabacteria bacterium]
MSKSFLKFCIVNLTIAVAMGAFILPYISLAAAPTVISYQGRLTNASGVLQNGSFDFRFSIWDDPTPPGGAQLWPALTPGTTTLTVTDGVFNVNIGGSGFPDTLTYDFNTNSTVYLQVEVFNTISSLWETLSPRQQITSSGYAINANTLAGRTPGTSADNVLLIDSSGDVNIAGKLITNTNIQGGSTLTSGNAFLINTASGFTGNLMDLKVNGSSKLSVNELGNTVVGGTLTVNTTGSSFTGTVTIGTLNTNTVTPSGAMTVGATGQSATLQGSTTTITSTGAGNDIVLNSADTIELQDNTNVTGNIDASGTIQSGSNNVTITLATGNIDADAIGLITADGAGSSSSGSGLETDTDRLGLLQGCANNQILKWNDGTSVWACAADSTAAGGSGTLQDAYDSGNTINTVAATDIAFFLDNDASFIVTTSAGRTGFTNLSLSDGSNATPPAQLLLINNTDTNEALASGLKISSAAGGITTGIDLSDADIVTALALGSNDVTVGGVTIDSTEFSLLNGRSGTLIDTANVAANATTAVTAGSGLTGGGTVGALTLNIGAGTGITVGADDISITPDSIGDTQLAFNTGQNLTTSSSVIFNDLTLTNTGLHVLDTDATHDLIIKPGSNLTADRTLTVTTGDADRTLTLAGDATISGTSSGTNTGDQTSVSGNAGTVTFADAAGDTTTFVALGTAATGSLAPATDAGLTYNATTDALTTTTFVGALSGN